MRISDLLDKRCIQLDASPRSKNEAIEAMVNLMCKSGKIIDKETYKKGVQKREEEGTTGIGDGIAIPHCASEAVSKPGLAAMVIKNGVDYDSLDGEPVHLIFLIASPKTKDNLHLEVLSNLSMMLMDSSFIKALMNAKTADEILNIIDEAEVQQNAETIKKEQQVLNRKNKILGVTACPAGIAHTFMAAKSLEQTAEAKGVNIKVETRGSAGVKNELTNAEIKDADCIIVAVDTNVPMARFNGKKVIRAKVADAIHKADSLIQNAMDGNAPIYHDSGAGEGESQGYEKETAGRVIYKNLMSGVSNMLPFVVGGGVLIALAFLFDSMSINLDAVSPEVRAQFGSITPVAAIFKQLGGIAFGFMLPILAGYIALSIGDRPALVVGLVGGYIAANGKSGFLGALVAGFLAGYLTLLLKKLFSKIPENLEGLKPVLIYPILGVLSIGLLMTYVVELPVGALNNALNTGLSNMNGGSKIFLGLILGGMMAVDMGGPVNKAAYVFGTASIAEGHYGIMAAVMIGGMIPPCAIALATIIFKNRFTAEERKSGPTSFIMGLAFITEGAIPYAAADPIRVLCSCMVGSSVAGALSMALGCELMAPHGGIFVFPLVTNPLLYLLALVIGTVVGGVMLGLLKKPLEQK